MTFKKPIVKWPLTTFCLVIETRETTSFLNTCTSMELWNRSKTWFDNQIQKSWTSQKLVLHAYPGAHRNSECWFLSTFFWLWAQMLFVMHRYVRLSSVFLFHVIYFVGENKQWLTLKSTLFEVFFFGSLTIVNLMQENWKPIHNFSQNRSRSGQQ